MYLASVLARLGRSNEARSVLEKASARRIASAELQLGNILSTEEGSEDRAIEMYRRSLAHGDQDARNNLAVILAERGDLEEAQQLLRDAIACGDELAAANLQALLGEEHDA